LVNSEALRRAGIRQWQEVEGGEMIRVGNEPTGMLIDKAMELVQEVIPPASKSERIRALREAEKDCLKYGLTSVGDAGLSKNDVALIDSLQSIGELHIQVYAMLSATDENFEHYLANGPTQTDRLTVRSFKFYADGALGSRGACLLQPYADRLDSQHRGFMLTDIDELETIALALKEAGFQMNTHCIGDSANRAVLDLYGRVLESSNDLRWRIEHAQVVHAQDLPKFNEFTIIPSVQPVHATSDMPWAELRLGRNRIRRAYAYADLLKQNGLLALGTDFPVEAISPFQTWYAAVERKSVDGEPKEGFFFNQRLSPEQTLLGMTLWAAIAQFEEHHKGSLAEGKWADFIIIDRDLLNASPSAVLETKVLETRIHGERVYRYE
jgi:predicted amidohydrolase YtcJ